MSDDLAQKLPPVSQIAKTAQEQYLVGGWIAVANFVRSLLAEAKQERAAPPSQTMTAPMTDLRAELVEVGARAFYPKAMLTKAKKDRVSAALDAQIAHLTKRGMSGWLVRNPLRFPFAVYFVETESDAWIRLVHRWNLAPEQAEQLRAAAWTIEPVVMMPAGEKS